MNISKYYDGKAGEMICKLPLVHLEEERRQIRRVMDQRESIIRRT